MIYLNAFTEYSLEFFFQFNELQCHEKGFISIFEHRIRTRQQTIKAGWLNLLVFISTNSTIFNTLYHAMGVSNMSCSAGDKQIKQTHTNTYTLVILVFEEIICTCQRVH